MTRARERDLQEVSLTEASRFAAQGHAGTSKDRRFLNFGQDFQYLQDGDEERRHHTSLIQLCALWFNSNPIQ